jgi:archaellum biogenesis ATPase FlaH
MPEGQDPFVYIKPTELSVETITKIRNACQDLNKLILDEIPQSRERALAITKLEELSMWANKAIVFNQTESVEEGK